MRSRTCQPGEAMAVSVRHGLPRPPPEFDAAAGPAHVAIQPEGDSWCRFSRNGCSFDRVFLQGAAQPRTVLLLKLEEAVATHCTSEVFAIIPGSPPPLPGSNAQGKPFLPRHRSDTLSHVRADKRTPHQAAEPVDTSPPATARAGPCTCQRGGESMRRRLT